VDKFDNCGDRKGLILATFEDTLAQFLYYDRKEDSKLPVGAIEDALLAEELTVVDLLMTLREHVRESMDSRAATLKKAKDDDG